MPARIKCLAMIASTQETGALQFPSSFAVREDPLWDIAFAGTRPELPPTVGLASAK